MGLHERIRSHRRLRLASLVLRFWWLVLLYHLHIRRDAWPYSPRRPAEYGGGGSGDMATPEQAMAFMQQQHDSGSTAWYNLCEKLCRSSYRLPAMYASAELHGENIPTGFRHGRSEPPAKGSLCLYLNGGYGHIVVGTGDGWKVWTNDYTGRGKVGKADARELASWCGADTWYVADAWWSNKFYRETQEVDMPLSDEDIEKIARKVWSYDVDPSGGKYSASGALWTAFQRTAVLNDVGKAVWGYVTRTLTSGGSGGSGPSAEEIANATATKFSDRLKS